ncbi:MAG: ATPase, T2SS/T4P/T4SS family [Patescibacteria group bacterium]|nr:ATPase, T2SS/T4P/T4SS family [Patescibacteria group bacterium]
MPKFKNTEKAKQIQQEERTETRTEEVSPKVKDESKQDTPQTPETSVEKDSPDLVVPRGKYDTFGEVLLAGGLITEAQKDELHLESVNLGKSEVELVQEKDWLSSKEFAKAKAKFLGVPFVEIAGQSIPQEILELVPEPTAKNYGVIPLGKKGGELQVAMLDPLDLPAVELLERRSGVKVKPALAEKGDLEAALERFYGEEKVEAEISEAVEAAAPKATTKIEERIKKMEDADKIIREAPVSRIVSRLLEYGVKARASDIHIEPLEDRTRVRYRIDGVLRERFELPRRIHSSIVARVKILSRLRLDERRLPQDGRFKIEVGEIKVDLRVSIVPTVFGEKVVIRFLEETGNIMSLEELGLFGVSLRRIKNAIKQPNGIMLVTGPTGSGKTLTLASSITTINDIGVNIVTLEDPVEIKLEGVTQIQVNREVGLTFASGLRSILRQDPDIVMVGEIRDQETAELSIHAALTGHLVFSTLHTNSAAGALPRMLDMGVEPYLLTSTVNAVVAQRLVRTVCKKCKKPYHPPKEVLDQAKDILGEKLFQENANKNDEGKYVFWKGEGCEHCEGSGYKGRTGIFEVLAASDPVSRLVLERQPTQAIEEQAIKEGMVTLRQDGFLKVIQGSTTPEEVLRVTRDEDVEEESDENASNV